MNVGARTSASRRRTPTLLRASLALAAGRYQVELRSCPGSRSRGRASFTVSVRPPNAGGVERRDRRLAAARHLDEAEAARPTGLTVGDEVDGIDVAVRAEQLANLVRRARVGQIADVDAHRLALLAPRGRNQVRNPTRRFALATEVEDSPEPERFSRAGRTDAVQSSSRRERAHQALRCLAMA